MEIYFQKMRYVIYRDRWGKCVKTWITSPMQSKGDNKKSLNNLDRIEAYKKFHEYKLERKRKLYRWI